MDNAKISSAPINSRTAANDICSPADDNPDHASAHQSQAIYKLILRVAVNRPLPNLFDYLPSEEIPTPPLKRGLRLKVPFGTTIVLGFLWDWGSTTAIAVEKLKPVLAWLDQTPLLTSQDCDLLAWAADYYQHPLGEVCATVLPLQRGRLYKSKRHDTVTNGIDTFSIPSTPPSLTLNAEQATAVTAVTAALGRFRVFLLDGVTGSGKTEVYLRLMERVLSADGQVLLLVPEIGLTPQLQTYLTRRLQAPLVVLHSGLTALKRNSGWREAQCGRAAVVLGTRSAIFTPLPRLALIVVDEEHDPSFKQQEGFCYSARDLAVRRAYQQGCPVLLGSATPSLESLHNATLGRYTRLALPTRAGGAALPALDLIDIRSVNLQDGLSPALIRLVRENIAAGQQSLLFINRRGYAPRTVCRQCGWTARCPDCDLPLTLHHAIAILWCHHCEFQMPATSACPQCGKADPQFWGQGTERIEAALARIFKGVPLARIDRDSTRRQGSLEQVLEDARAGRYPLLVGTQIVAKGHHFPDVTLVGVLNLDQGFYYGGDYRATERMAQLIVQVAGRAGRGLKPGRVALQTRHPDHPLLNTLIRAGYGAFAAQALEERAAAALPPYAAVALLRAESRNAAATAAFLNAALSSAELLPAGVEILGPVPANIGRRAGVFRLQLLLFANCRQSLRTFLSAWLPILRQLPEAPRTRWLVDVDPLEL